MIYNPFVEEEIINNYKSKTYSWRAWYHIKINDRTVYSEVVNNRNYTVVDVEEFVYRFMDKFDNDGIELFYDVDVVTKGENVEINYELNGHSQSDIGNIKDVISNRSILIVVKQMLNDYVKNRISYERKIAIAKL